MADEQSSENGGIVSHFQDATDGTIIWQQKGSGDNGRGCTGPLMANTKGWQMWSGAGGLFDASQKTVGSVPGSDNFTIWWGADLTRFLLNGTSISPYSGSGGGTGLSASGCTSNNTSKSTPALTADIFGDWREELVLRTTGNDALRIYTTTTPTKNRLYTLMHDPIYRLSVATENVAYNQPPEPGIYIGPQMTLPQAKPAIKYYTPGSVPTGGTPGTGGTTSAGGAAGGGATASGGAGGAGGAKTSGGAAGAGGAGGAKTSGGTTGLGGAGASGGTIGSSGAAGAGEAGGTTGKSSVTTSAPSASGGSSETGGVTGEISTTAGSGGGSTGTAESPGVTATKGKSGSGCRMAGIDSSAAPWGVMLVLGGLVAGKLRRRIVRQRRTSSS
jgi:rhamnogalacturonan endolyase